MDQETAIIHFDGGAVPNPGKAAAAAIIQWQGQTHTFSEFLGDRITNSVAEYNGLLLGLKEAKKLGIEQIKICGDSRLVINQVLGAWKVTVEHLKPLHFEATVLLAEFTKSQLFWVPRSENTAADAAATKCIKAN
ncbi:MULTISPECIES: ribonuclease HI family protein [unclassified Tolypothrix]|uniref:ribonuclease HI family protein n=1 Tax=unclassified Tolypothrix TaxID=2649714 RepID=UPI0005EAAF50|nr:MULTISPECIES: ribonuclease HI family protein [unclassified Tolypothrix]BAY90768.1 ribonuclease H like protein [Microchaete diplosiphon NIES-3275]EKF04397.1 ribonuclease H [Tolypothrix sp. PCC 7601]MBE9081033.1 ribonuclease HI family protein [Tolypothrix sp. LEGE 11397]UYD24901.1 ribonuclease HI family protein [Tolypothrix sp. PCC 7712]UYD32866.1 ribonuclease HI family protein [Tolypothrix sp. PCC 7601]